MIATSTKIDISSVSLPESVGDGYFAKSKSAKGTKEGEFFGEGGQKSELSDDRKSEQKVRLRSVPLARPSLLQHTHGSPFDIRRIDIRRIIC